MKKTLSELLLLVATMGLSLVSAANVRIICDYPITLKNVRASDGSLLGDITLEKDRWYSENYAITQYWNISYDNKQCPELSTTQTLTAELDGYRCKGWYTLQSNDDNTDGSMTRLSSCNTDSPLVAGQKGQAAVSINLSEKLRYAKTSAYAYFYSDPPAAVICPLFVKAWTIKTSVSPEGMGETAGGGLIDDGDSTTLVASNPADGYRFVRWEKDGELVSENSTYNFYPTGDGTYTAIFALPPRDLTITTSVSPKGKGTVTGGGDCKEGDSIVLTATPTNGYAFAGWTNATGVISTENPWKFAAADDLVCVAAFTSRWYQISFADSAGTPPEPVFRRFDEPMGELPRSIYENPYLSFTRWLDVNGNAVTAETILTNAADQTLHADVPSERTEYRIVFVDPSGECKPSAVTNYVQKGTPVTERMAASFSRPGFWQTGWNLVLPFEATSDCEVRAVWKSLSDVLDCQDLTFSIEPNSNWKIVEGDKHAGDSSLRIDERSTEVSDVVSTSVTEPGRLAFWWKGDAETKLTIGFGEKQISLEGSAGMGWRQETIEIKSASDSKPTTVKFLFNTGDFGTYCALDDISWNAGIEYKLSVAVDPSSPYGTVAKNPYQSTYSDGSLVTITAKANDGYAFEKWNDDVTESNRTVTITEDMTYTASFTACVYRVTLLQNGGTGGANEVSATYGEDMPVLESLPQCEHYTFNGYFDAASGGKQYYNGEGKSVADWDKAADAELFAQWVEDGKFTVTVTSANEARGTATKTPNREAYYANAEVTIEATPKAGYAFEQWNDNVTESSRKVTVTSNASYTASFTACVYRVTLNANGGTGGQAEAWATYGEALPNLSSLPTKAMYKFDGFYNAETGGSKYFDASGIGVGPWDKTADAELFAHWTKDVGDVSRALDCDNLVFEKSGDWEIVESHQYYNMRIDPHSGDRFLISTNVSGSLSTTITESGTLSFAWRGQGNDAQTTLKVLVNNVKSEHSKVLTANYEDKGWETETGIHFDVKQDAPLMISFEAGGTPAYWAIDAVTWTPDAAPMHPMPEAKDAVTISSASVSGGKFSLSFAGDAKFDYNLLTNANLRTDGWGRMETKSGTDETITFEMPILNGLPQLFYKVETIQKQE